MCCKTSIAACRKLPINRCISNASRSGHTFDGGEAGLDGIGGGEGAARLVIFDGFTRVPPLRDCPLWQDLRNRVHVPKWVPREPNAIVDPAGDK